MKYSCIYNSVSNKCSNTFTKEHIIQECVGGTLKSNELICEMCNKHFANSIDEELRKYYLKIIITIAKFLPASIQKQKIKIKTDKGIFATILPGQFLTYSGYHYFDEDKSIFSSVDHDFETIKNIFISKHGKIGKIKKVEKPISDILPKIVFPAKHGLQAFRACVKSTLNYVRYLELQGELESVNWEAAKAALNFVFHDKLSHEFSSRRVPFVDFVSAGTSKPATNGHFLELKTRHF